MQPCQLQTLSVGEKPYPSGKGFSLPSLPMKHLFFALLLAAGTPPALAQTATTTRLTSPDHYCTLIARGSHYGALQFQLDYGQQAAKYSGITPEQAKEDNTKLKDLFSVADVLNYLSGRGWDLVSVSTLLSEVIYPESSPTVRSVGGVAAPVRSEVQYLLRRRGQ